MKFFIIIIFSLIFYLNNLCAQSDTIPSPKFSLVIDGQTVVNKKSYFKVNTLNGAASFRVSGDPVFCKKYPMDCRYRVEAVKLSLISRNGTVKNEGIFTFIDYHLDLNEFFKNAQNYDWFKVECLKYVRIDKFNTPHIKELKQEPIMLKILVPSH